MMRITSVLAMCLLLLLTGCSDEIDTLPPDAFTLISVTNNATGVDVFPTFTWNASADPEGGSISYDLVIDTDNPPQSVYSNGLNTTNYLITERLSVQTTYFWKVIARDSDGGQTESNTFQFTTRDLRIPLTAVTDDAAFDYRGAHGSAVFQNNMWVIGGLSFFGTVDDVWNSSNGASWTKRTEGMFPARRDHTVEVFNDKMWVIAGGRTNSDAYNDVWNSTTGAFWTSATMAAPFSPRLYHESVIFDNKIWVFGGYHSGEGSLNDIWYSSDGVSWTEASPSAAFPGLTNSQVIEFNNKLWMIGGYNTDDNIYYNDIWESADGINWSLVTADAPFTGRTHHKCVVFDDKIWLIGGFSIPGGELNDIWYSDDGALWHQLTASAPFSPRQRHSCIVFDDKIWVIGGDDHDDVWALD